MTPAELEHKLRTLSEHEKGYRAGKVPVETRPFIDIDGVKVLKSSFWDIYRGTRESAPLICCKQHSRFREYPLHTHDFVELAYMYDGMCVETLSDRLLGLRKGQVLLVDSGTIHTIAPLREQDILVNIQVEKSYFTSNFFNRLETDSLVTSFFVNAISRGVTHDNYILFHSEKSRRFPIFMNELMCECLDPSPRSENMLHGLFSLVVSELIDVYEQGVDEGTVPLQSPALPILRYIEKNFRDCTLKGCADEFCVSTSYLAKLLKRECGLTFKEVVQKQRIEEAKRLLANDTLSVTDVARNVGYSNMSFFYKMFKRECGVLPGQYRRQE